MSKGGKIATVTGMTLVFEVGAGEMLASYWGPPQYILPVTGLFCITTIILAWINKEDPISLLTKKLFENPDKAFSFLSELFKWLFQLAIALLCFLYATNSF